MSGFNFSILYNSLSWISSYQNLNASFRVTVTLETNHAFMDCPPYLSKAKSYFNEIYFLGQLREKKNRYQY